MKAAQSCPTLCDPLDDPVHGTLQARTLESVACPLLQGIFPTQESNPGLLHCRQILYQLPEESLKRQPKREPEQLTEENKGTF